MALVGAISELIVRQLALPHNVQVELFEVEYAIVSRLFVAVIRITADAIDSDTGSRLVAGLVVAASENRTSYSGTAYRPADITLKKELISFIVQLNVALRPWIASSRPRLSCATTCQRPPSLSSTGRDSRIEP